VFESLSHTLPGVHAVDKVVGASGCAGGGWWLRGDGNRPCVAVGGWAATKNRGTHAWHAAASSQARTHACKTISGGSVEGQCMAIVVKHSSVLPSTHCSWWSSEPTCCLQRTQCRQSHRCSSWQHTLMESKSHRLVGGGEDARQHCSIVASGRRICSLAAATPNS